MIKELSSKDIKSLKEEWHKDQNSICPIMKLEFDLDKMVIDHAHTIVKDGTATFCRGAIFNAANMLEGKIQNNFVRMGLGKYISLPCFLRNLADYLEKNKAHEEIKYIHPSEIKKKILSKRNYNKLKKVFIKAYANCEIAGSLPEYPKSKRLNKRLEFLYNHFDINPYN